MWKAPIPRATEATASGPHNDPATVEKELILVPPRRRGGDSTNSRATARLTVRASGKKGKGVFATTEIQRGTMVIEFWGRARWIWEIPERFWNHCFQVDYDTYVLPKPGSFGWYINHSCNPSCVIRGERELASLRRIRKGDELTFDYSTNVGWDGFVMHCSCRSANCRKRILSYGRLGERTKRRYGEMVSPFLLSKKAKPILF